MQRQSANDRSHEPRRSSLARASGASRARAAWLCGAAAALVTGFAGCDRPVEAPSAATTTKSTTTKSTTTASTTPSTAPVTSPAASGGRAPASASATAAASASSAPVPAPASGDAPAALGPVHQLSVLDLDGNKVSLAKFAGRPMIIEIWATWCGPCRANRRNVHELKTQGRLPERLAVVGVSVDTGAALVKGFLKSNPGNEAEFMASPEFNEFVRARNASPSIPKTLYVDAKGRVADLAEGVQSQKWLEAMARNLR